MRLVLLGAPGAGKGTQADFIKNTFKIAHISTGDIFRANLNEGTELGLQAQKYMDEGKLVPDDLVMSMVADKLSEFKKSDGFMLDGFPRTVKQAEFLDTKTNIDAVILFNVPDEMIVKRLTSRAVCKTCGKVTNLADYEACPVCNGELYRRGDDNERTIRHRLKVFHEQTEPLIDFYRSAGKLIEIDAKGLPDEVFSHLSETLKTLKK